MSRGYTLIELVAVVTLLIVAALVVAPAIAPGIEPDPATLAAQQVAARLVTLRRNARKGGAAAVFVFEPRSAHYWELMSTPAGFELIHEGDVSVAGVRWTYPGNARAMIRFEPTGATAGDSLVVESGAAESMIRFDRLTGEVEVVSS